MVNYVEILFSYLGFRIEVDILLINKYSMFVNIVRNVFNVRAILIERSSKHDDLEGIFIFRVRLFARKFFFKKYFFVLSSI